ncbi:MAG: 4-hydroxy-3-methylbut-2-enyl diphosphate reductase [Sphaerochaetaceae bacterium]
MVVKQSQVTGYCSGVSEVIKKAQECLKTAKEKNLPAYSIGWFIHNPTVVKQFESEGMSTIESPYGKKPGVALIRAHGLADPLRDEFLKAGFILIDGTCPTVAYSQRLIRDSNDDEKIIILGLKGHSEVVALSNVYNKENKIVDVAVVETENEVEKLPPFGDKKIVMLSQTTFPYLQYKLLKEKIEQKFRNRVTEKNRLCPTTFLRHQAIRELCKEVEAVLVVGGKISSNTATLAQIVKKEGLPVWHIESAQEIPKVIYDYNIVGVAGGTSTPPLDIERVVTTLQKIKGC